jgi:hypothetical protein
VLKRSRSQISADDLNICVQHYQTLLENIFRHGLVYLLQLGIVEWCHLITTLFLLAKMTASTPPEHTQTSAVKPLLMLSIDSLRVMVEQAKVAGGQVETSAPHLIGWIDRILTALIQQTSRSEIVELEPEESAFELVNAFITRRERATDDFWSNFMSEWLQW